MGYMAAGKGMYQQLLQVYNPVLDRGSSQWKDVNPVLHWLNF